MNHHGSIIFPLMTEIHWIMSHLLFLYQLLSWETTTQKVEKDPLFIAFAMWNQLSRSGTFLEWIITTSSTVVSLIANDPEFSEKSMRIFQAKLKWGSIYNFNENKPIPSSTDDKEIIHLIMSAREKWPFLDKFAFHFVLWFLRVEDVECLRSVLFSVC